MRKLTIGRKVEKRQASPNGLASVPKCTLTGVWLRDAGFEIGEQVRVTTKAGRIVITKAEG